MNSVKNNNDSVLQEKIHFYTNGFLKGNDDARCGLRMKFLSKKFLLSNKMMNFWELGYKRGYNQYYLKPELHHQDIEKCISEDLKMHE